MVLIILGILPSKAEEAGVEPTEDACAPSNGFEARAPHRERYSSAGENAVVLPVMKGRRRANGRAATGRVSNALTSVGYPIRQGRQQRRLRHGGYETNDPRCR